MSTARATIEREVVEDASEGGPASAGRKDVERFTLRNAAGMEARILTLGGIVSHLFTPDRRGVMGDVVLGHDDVRGYRREHPYFGCLVGRYANRIAKGRFTLNGREHRLAVNNGPNALHGGLMGFDKVTWDVGMAGVGVEGARLTLVHESPAGHEGYPGKLQVLAEYTLTNDHALRLKYRATSDADTIVNLTQHSYFNLAGHASGDVLGHVARINADAFTPVDGTLIPTGEIRPVAGTAMDFRQERRIGERIDEADEQLRYGGGYDHNWVIRQTGAGATGMAGTGKGALGTHQASVYEPGSGRTLDVFSTEPGLQFYTGNFLDGTIRGKGGVAYGRRAGFCMEPQRFPDSPNQPGFPSAVLRAGEVYHHALEYRFGVRERGGGA